MKYWEKMREKGGSDLWEPESNSSLAQKWDLSGSVVHGAVQNTYIIYNLYTHTATMSRSYSCASVGRAIKYKNESQHRYKIVLLLTEVIVLFLQRQHLR